MVRAFEEQSEALLREYSLFALGSDPGVLDEIATARQARESVIGAMESELAGGPEEPAQLDLQLVVGQHVSPRHFKALQELLNEATRLATAGELLALAPLPEIVSVRNWICEQVVVQSAGSQPTAWNPDDIALDVNTPLAQWPEISVLPDDVAWVAGDDHNRIIGASPAACEMLGWQHSALVGQRIVKVIPPELREAHVAGFTQALVSGTFRILDQPVDVAAWTQDGVAVPVTLTLQRHRAQRGRSVFVAWLEPRSPKA